MNEALGLEGKLVGFVLSSSDGSLFLLQNAKVETIAGRTFVTGTVPSLGAAGDSWVHGLSAAVAWDNVGYYVVFKSEEDYKSREKGAHRPRWKHLFEWKNG
jgi:hypothetical protein